MQSVSAAFTAEERDTVRNIAHSLQVSWKKESTLGSRTFTIGVSLIGGNDIIGVNPGAVGSPGIYRYFDESDYVNALSWERHLNFPSGGLSKAMAEVELENTTGRFTPRYMGGNSELFTSILPRRPFIINAGFDIGGVDITLPQFAGILTRQPRVDSRSKSVQLVGADYVDFFQNRFLDQTVMFTGQRTDEVFSGLFDQLGMSTAQYELDYGINIIQFGLFESGTRFSEVFHKLAEAENGHVYQDEEGIFRFENRQHWDSSPHNTVSRIVLTGQVLEAEAPDDANIINVVEIKGTPRAKEQNQLVWQLIGFAGADAQFIPAGGDKEIWVNFDDPMLAIDTPVPNGTVGQTSYFGANTLQDASGIDMTSSITLKYIQKFATTAKLIFSNNSTTDGAFLTYLDIWGRPARRTGNVYYRSSNGLSLTAYEERSYILENEFIQSQSWARTYGEMILQDWAQPENMQKLTIRAIPELQLGDMLSWQGRYWRVYDIKTKLDAGVGFIQELMLIQKTLTTYFRIGISTIGGPDRISP